MRNPLRWLPWTRLALDAVAVGVAIPLAYFYRFHIDRIPIPGNEPPALRPYLQAVPIFVLAFLLTFQFVGVYQIRRGRALIDEMITITGASVLGGLVTLALMSLYRGFLYSRLVLLYSVILALVLIAIGRLALRQVLIRRQRRGLDSERVLVVGTGTGSETLIHRMTMFPQYGYAVAGVLDDRLPVGDHFAGTAVLGRIADLPEQIDKQRIDEVFLALPGAPHETLLHLIKICDDKQVDFKMLPDLFEIITTRVSADIVDGIPLVGIQRSQVSGASRVIKRAFDLVVAIVLAVLLSPLLLALAVAIRLSGPGPVLFRQERVGRAGRVFTVYKFRSMVPDAEAETGPVFASPNDERRTAIGRLMRRFSLDELPQLINIIRGEMSLVGPRPERPFFVERFGAEIPRYLERHQVRPGVTGWAQVNDLRGDTSIANRTIYDIYYVENWSLIFDIRIIVLTVARILFHQHAY